MEGGNSACGVVDRVGGSHFQKVGLKGVIQQLSLLALFSLTGKVCSRVLEKSPIVDPRFSNSLGGTILSWTLSGGPAFHHHRGANRGHGYLTVHVFCGFEKGFQLCHPG